jgi:hypothetical protein
VVTRTSEQGEAEIVTDLSDWRVVGGVKVSHKLQQTEVVFDVDLADSLFAK